MLIATKKFIFPKNVGRAVCMRNEIEDKPLRYKVYIESIVCYCSTDKVATALELQAGQRFADQ